ncbi:hypothetical protein L1887_10958 [Cichorium endivia]|nr:hypothetical protein L1887_10958 [Cichorium endivia]
MPVPCTSTSDVADVLDKFADSLDESKAVLFLLSVLKANIGYLLLGDGRVENLTLSPNRVLAAQLDTLTNPPPRGLDNSGLKDDLRKNHIQNKPEAADPNLTQINLKSSSSLLKLPNSNQTPDLYQANQKTAVTKLAPLAGNSNRRSKKC